MKTPAGIALACLAQASMFPASPRSQMVANQLRASSGSAVSWWAKQRSYAVSLAVNSMLGYLIGLGDR